MFWSGRCGMLKRAIRCILNRVMRECFEERGVVFWRVYPGCFEESGVVLWRCRCVTLKRVLIWEAWYFQEGYLVLSKGLFGNLKRVHCLVFWWVWFGMCLFERSHPLRNVHSIKCLTCCLMSCFDIDFISIFEIVCEVSTFLVYLCLYS